MEELALAVWLFSFEICWKGARYTNMKLPYLLTAILAAAVVAEEKPGLPVTAEQQSKLTPGSVLGDLMAGNKRYVKGELTPPNVIPRIKAATKGQFPKAFILSCIDSRVPVEQVFDQGLGDVFVGRVAGNIENTDQLGSMEYAAKVAGVKLILVLGHEGCGAVKGACDHVELGNITSLLKNIRPAMDKVKGYKKEEKNSKTKKYVDEVIEKNVQVTIADIRKRSTVLSEMEKEGDLKIVGGVYSLADGSVRLLD